MTGGIHSSAARERRQTGHHDAGRFVGRCWAGSAGRESERRRRGGRPRAGSPPLLSLLAWAQASASWATEVLPRLGRLLLHGLLSLFHFPLLFLSLFYFHPYFYAMPWPSMCVYMCAKHIHTLRGGPLGVY
jgi:hypothetical protein